MFGKIENIIKRGKPYKQSAQAGGTSTP